MQCPMGIVDCITCEDKCILEERKRHGDPCRRGRELRTDIEELRLIGLLPKTDAEKERLLNRFVHKASVLDTEGIVGTVKFRGWLESK